MPHSGTHRRIVLASRPKCTPAPGSWRNRGRCPDALLDPASGALKEKAIVRCYLHGNEFASQGWYTRGDRVIRLSKPFKMRP
jgi:hypothetical protein